MAISLRVQKMLWGRAANRCALCRCELVLDKSETDDESIVGDVCHIVADSPDGPRGNSLLTEQQRNQYNNLILLCKVHHKLIDDQPNTYTVDDLHELKSKHENWVRTSLEDYQVDKQRADEIYAEIIDEWEKLADLENWEVWSSSVLSSWQPGMGKDHDGRLEELRLHLLSRIWPRRYPELDAAFENFRLVLQDFQELFRKHAVGWGDDRLITKKFYQIPEWNPELYGRLSKKYDFHVALVEDLMLELTRAANYICDRVREFVFSAYRIKDGALLVQSGPYGFMEFRTSRVEYISEERVMIPYPGLIEFLKDRETRDMCFGTGISVDDPNFSTGDDFDIDSYLSNPITN
jgi:hypothetical protein